MLKKQAYHVQRYLRNDKQTKHDYRIRIRKGEQWEIVANHFHKFRMMEKIHLQQLYDLKILLQPQGLLLQHQHPHPLAVEPRMEIRYTETNFTTSFMAAYPFALNIQQASIWFVICMLLLLFGGLG